MKNFIQIQPSQGSLGQQERVTIKVRLICLFPQDFKQYLVFQVAHFEPKRVLMKGFGVFNSISI